MQVNFIQTKDQYKEALSKLREISKLCLGYRNHGAPGFVGTLSVAAALRCGADSEDRTVYVFDLFKVPVEEDLKQYIETRDLLVIHNANFDFQFLFSLGIDYKGKVFDTYLAERVLRAGFKEKRVSPQANKPYFADVSCSLKAVLERRLEIQNR
jgi:hypothetical protein